MDTSLNKKFANVEWGKCRISDLFDIENTLSFNKDKLVAGNEYDYVTRTSLNQGVFQETGFVNKENLNSANVWSLGLLQMDFFYRKKQWYAGQFVRKIIPKFETTERNVIFITAILNRLKPILLQVLVRNVDETFKNQNVSLPYKNGEIDFDFMDSFVAELEAERILELEAYLSATGLKDYKLTLDEQRALDEFESRQVMFEEFTYKSIFNQIKQGRRLRKEDQIPGNIPFVMAGTTNTGVVNCVSNPVAIFQKNSITIDIFGNTFYRGYDFGAGDDTGVYHNDTEEYSKETMLYFATTMNKSITGKFSYGNKLRSSQSINFKMKLPVLNNQPDYTTMETLISAIQKLVIKDVVLYTDRKVAATKAVVQQAEMQTDNASVYYDSFRPQVDLPMIAEEKSDYQVD
ncbi:restriction endonuclease subunit S [Listeria welshimeri]|uniref:restriction endonuclease subunit S n=1 Tax=Listeria welshimeri TaxID=1643 RepID=UPI0016258FE0|nr:restriction endonuclease subunit S [Listeria welshimeri]MBC2081448.1 restriction endonuclease subunit S [Listeria welshimeri]MBF2411548.1 restriction endonuclease subunit S [Listeria welshimeri]MBF2469664.1 restriction endonuclease subunit S [Listeria welshimeri]MBF2621981.1 restriction endonuclease subunit S [Listeria welshimeri]